MRKISCGSSRYLLSIPEPYRDWIDENVIKTRKFSSTAEYLRYLLRQDIQRHGPLPEITPKPPRKRKTAAVSPRVHTPPSMSDPVPAPSA